MASLLGTARLPVLLLASIMVTAATSSCSRLGLTSEQAEVTRTFSSWKNAMIDNHIDQVMIYIPGHVDDYLNELNAHVVNSSSASPSPSPGVDLFLRVALEKKVPADLRANLSLRSLLQRIADHHLFNPRDIRELDLGRVSINGDRASAEVYYQGTLTALRLPFVKEGDDWKIDVMALLPYAEVLMRVDRAIKGETVTQQVDQLVSKLPSL
jgi:hypothetical protein